MRTTLSQALTDSISRIPTSLNIAPSDPRCTTYINIGTSRIMTRGHWWGTCPSYRVSVTSQIFTLPPQFANIEKIAVCQHPVGLRNLWYSYNNNGPGVVNDPTAAAPNTCNSQALFRGTACTFKDIVGTTSKLKVVCDVAADVGTNVLLLGYDANGNWLRTQVLGVWQDGEVVTLAQSPGTISVNTFSRITDIQKPVTKGQIWLYEQDGVTNPLIANYAYWESNPQYQRFLLPTISGTSTQIDLVGKLSYRPVTNPTDYLLIGNLEAVRLAAMSVKASEEHNFTEAGILMEGGASKSGIVVEGAIPILQAELQHYTGDGATPSIEVVSAFGECGVEALL
jgi:hypothetical protein